MSDTYIKPDPTTCQIYNAFIQETWTAPLKPNPPQQSMDARQTFLLDIYTNLTDRFIRWLYATSRKSTTANSKAATAIMRHLKKLKDDGRQDLISDFICEKLTDDVIETYSRTWKTSTVILVMFKNFIIDRYEHASVVKRHTVSMSDLNDAQFEALMNTPVTESTDENLFAQKLELLKAFERILPAPYKEIMPYYVERYSAHKIAGILDRPERTVSYQIKKIEAGFRTFAVKQLGGV